MKQDIEVTWMDGHQLTCHQVEKTVQEDGVLYLFDGTGDLLLAAPVRNVRHWFPVD